MVVDQIALERVKSGALVGARLGPIPASAQIVINDRSEFVDKRFRKYQPYDALQVQNNADEDVRVEVNGDSNQVLLIPAKTQQSYNQGKIYEVYVINENTTTSTADGEIRLQFQRIPADQDRIGEQLARLLAPLLPKTGGRQF